MNIEVRRAALDARRHWIDVDTEPLARLRAHDDLLGKTVMECSI
jgi:hypothetical protein